MSSPIFNFWKNSAIDYGWRVIDQANVVEDTFNKALEANSGYTLSERCVQLCKGMGYCILYRIERAAAFTGNVTVLGLLFAFTPVAAIVWSTPLMRIKKVESVINELIFELPILVQGEAKLIIFTLMTFISLTLT